ncbi:MAG: GYF domain-containing protein [Akkermansia sp.]|nr:GYF domain-containing protein [Akkermansia sp.]
MRYLYHLSEGNKGPVTFEQLQALAQAGTIDNMTPVLAEGAREWSRWLFIKNAPQGTPAPAPTPKKEAPAPVTALNRPVAKPAEQPKKEAPKAAPTHAPKAAAPAPKPEETKTAPTPTPAPEVLPAAEKDAVVSKPFSLREFYNELNLMQLIPAAVCAGITLLSLLAAGIWTFMAHDTRTQYAELRAMAAEHEQKRADLESLQAQQQQVADEKEKLAAEIVSLQHTLQLTLEESARLAKGPYISEAEDKQLKEEQYKATKLKEQEEKL